jgi:metal-responsive CopG/Arc/MetJ family transcriptional regulator
MSTAKIAITIDKDLLERLDRCVGRKQLPSRSRVVQEAIQEKLDRLERGRLARECQKLDPQFEQEMAELGMREDLEQWPEY